MSPDHTTEPGRDLDTIGYALRVLRRRWKPLVAVVAACAFAALVKFETTDKVYEASASVAFGTSNLSQTALQVDTSSSDPQRDASTKVVIARSPQVAAAVRKQLRTPASVASLIKAVDVSTVPNANVLTITARSGDPQSAARLANAFAGQYIAFEAQSQIEGIRQAERDLEQQLSGLSQNSSQRDSLETSLQRLAQLRAVANANSKVIGWATAPAAAAGLSGKTMLALGILIGLALGLTLIFIIESVDRRVRSLEDFEHEYRLASLAGVPQQAFRERRAIARRDDLEPYRILRSALDFVAVTRTMDTLLVTSAVPGEGKTTVSVDLAHAYALTGRRVILVELDLRRPSFTSHFDIDGRRGVTTALTGADSLDRLLVEPFEDLPELSVLPSGVLPPNPSELLGSQATVELMRELRAEGALVILDAPPLNPVADTQVLLNVPGVDGAVIVARVGRTTRDEARRARAILDRHVVAPLGLVVTGLEDPDRYGYATYETAPGTGETLGLPEPPKTASRRSR